MVKIEQLLKNAGHTELLEIQKSCIDTYQKHDEIILLSGTGTGKTLAFLFSILKKLRPQNKTTEALIIVPTRELALQVFDAFNSLKSGYKATVCYGGHSMKDESNSLKETPDLVIGTPGRLLDHLQRGNLKLRKCQTLVIDEFDKCLELGFEDEMEQIVYEIPASSGTILVSATDLTTLPGFMGLNNPKTLDFLDQASGGNLQEYSVRYQGDIFDQLTTLLQGFGRDKSIVFCNYREVAEDVSQRLAEQNIINVCYHGGLKQEERERALIKYRNGSSNVLVCTDLGARGLDIPEVKHVIHYQYPGSYEALVHRTGRTARMTADGASYVFIGPDTQLPEYMEAPEQEFFPLTPTDTTPEWKTLYFGSGKKEKINKIDIVGFLSKKGGLKPNEIGLITVADHSCYVAVAKNKTNQTLKRIRGEKIKGKRVKIAVSK